MLMGGCAIGKPVHATTTFCAGVGAKSSGFMLQHDGSNKIPDFSIYIVFKKIAVNGIIPHFQVSLQHLSFSSIGTRRPPQACPHRPKPARAISEGRKTLAGVGEVWGGGLVSGGCLMDSYI